MIAKNFSNLLNKFKNTFQSIICVNTISQPIDQLKLSTINDQPKQIIQNLFAKTNQPILNHNQQSMYEIGHIQYPANNPIEDRYHISYLKSIQAQVITVFDGHGGYQMAEFANENLHKILEKCLIENKQLFNDLDDLIQYSLKDAYQIVEQELYELAKQAQKQGQQKVGSIGTCALTAIIMEDRLYSANLGDCKGIIINEQNCNYKKINHMQNASSKKEQMRLKEIFEDEEDIVVQKKGCYYVKNLLQPTRTFGDYRLKYIEFSTLNNFKGPYIHAIPDQQIIELETEDRYLVMGSDGLWDELSKQEISSIVVKNRGNVDKIIKEIFDQSLTKAAQNSKLSLQQLKLIPQGERRRFHDDITIIVVDLKK